MKRNAVLQDMREMTSPPLESLEFSSFRDNVLAGLGRSSLFIPLCDNISSHDKLSAYFLEVPWWLCLADPCVDSDLPVSALPVHKVLEPLTLTTKAYYPLHVIFWSPVNESNLYSADDGLDRKGTNIPGSQFLDCIRSVMSSV